MASTSCPNMVDSPVALVVYMTCGQAVCDPPSTFTWGCLWPHWFFPLVVVLGGANGIFQY